MSELKTYFKENFKIPESDLTLIMNAFQEQSLKKGEYFLKEGQYCTKQAYLESGSFYYYMNIDGNEKVCDFAFEGAWMSYNKSLMGNIPSDMNIKALKDSKIQWVTMDGLKNLSNDISYVQEIGMKIMQYYFIQTADRAADLANLTAEQRYHKAIQENPNLLNVPQYHLASFLGIKPQSLSRIRAKK